MNSGFTVDTHLLRELGELLVGRDSTAVIELIKNGYDADASNVVLQGSDLGSADARLHIIDDGNGMTRERFQSAFLRIAGRDKEVADRKSPEFGRRYTGQKGIGRLASQKIAAKISIVSVPRKLEDKAFGVSAVIDWDDIEQQDDLDNLTYGLKVESLTFDQNTPSGTQLELRSLRSTWTDKRISTFVNEVQSALPPDVLVSRPSGDRRIGDEPLIGAISVRYISSDADPGFSVDLRGDFETGDDYWNQASREFQWMIEIDASTEDVKYQITPLARYVSEEPLARTYHFQKKVSLRDRPAFQARIFTMRGASVQRGPLKGFVRSKSGIRVYLEGFRVLPYGEYGDDWLGIDRDYRQGPRFYDLDLNEGSDVIEIDKNEALNATSNIGYYGAVFLNEGLLGNLRSLINREGFVQNESYDSLVDIVQTGVRLSVRVRRALSTQRAAQDREDQLDASLGNDDGFIPESEQSDDPNPATSKESGFGEDDTSIPPPDSEAQPHQRRPTRKPESEISRRKRFIAEADIVADRAVEDGDSDLNTVLRAMQIFRSELSAVRALQPDLRILASVGLQLSAFVHEINGMLSQAQTIRGLINVVLEDATLTGAQRRTIRRISQAAEDLAHSLSRQSSYLTDAVSADPRRRRSRIRLSDRVDTVHRMLTNSLSKRGATLLNEIPRDLKTPPIFPAEVSVLITNLFTNAIKNAGAGGTILIDAAPLGDRGISIGVHNTGTAVNLSEAERWFLPFETTTTEVDETLGQGLGLGLPIVRALVDDYQGTVEFVKPRRGYATSIIVNLPDPQEIG